jgi:hypothetical protein
MSEVLVVTVGTQGADGADGVDGVQGADGGFMYVAYADDAIGTGFTNTFNSSKDYIAFLQSETEIPTPVAGDFAGLWKNYKGQQGIQGIAGNDGNDGADGLGVPAGGLTGEALIKSSNVDNDTEWAAIAAGGLPSGWLNVMDYGATGDGTTDDSAAIQAAIDAAALIQGTVYFPRGVYVHATPIDLQNTSAVTLRGAGAATPWTFHSPYRMASVTKFTGTGTAPAWDASNCLGLTILDLQMTYSNSGFTGHFIRAGHASNPSDSLLIERCRIMGWTDSLITAESLISVAFCIVGTIRKCNLYGAQHLIKGFDTGVNEAPNSITVDGCILQGGQRTYFCNIGDWWTIKDNTVEAFVIPGLATNNGVPESIVGSTIDNIGSTFDYRNNQHWDCVQEDCVIWKQRATNTWVCNISENFIDATFINTIHFDLQGLGVISIRNNAFGQIFSPSFPTLIDLGNPATAKKTSVTITGNAWNSGGTDAPDAIVNILGHDNVNIHSNSSSGYFNAIHTIEGHERVGYVGASAGYTPNVAASAGQSLSSISITGSDTAGHIIIQTGGSPTVVGALLDVTFAQEYIASNGSGLADKVPVVILQPCGSNVVNGDNSIACQPYPRYTSNTRTGFSIYTKNAIPSSTYAMFSYRVIGL